MGNENSCDAQPYKFTLAELKDLAIQDGKQMEKGCGAAIEGRTAGNCEETLRSEGFGWPDNGEFDWGGMGSDCNLCTWNYGCECNQGGQYIGGKRGKVKRVAFKGDPTECCLANTSGKDSVKTIGDFTCDPKYRNPGGTDCVNVYADYCKVGNRMINDPKCKALESSSYTVFSNLMKDKCNLDDFYQTTECINWCNNNSTQCNKLNTFQSCKEFGISINDCTPQKVLDVKTECQKYGIRSEQGLAISQCSPASIKTLIDQCKEYNVLDSCSPGALQDGIDNATRAEQLDITVKTQEQIQTNYDTTQKTITDILNLTEEPPATTAPPDQNIFDIQQSIKDFDINNIQQWIKDNSTMFMIIIVIMLLIICSSSSVSALLVIKK